jgi:hypothetical protein
MSSFIPDFFFRDAGIFWRGNESYSVKGTKIERNMTKEVTQ